MQLGVDSVALQLRLKRDVKIANNITTSWCD